MEASANTIKKWAIFLLLLGTHGLCSQKFSSAIEHIVDNNVTEHKSETTLLVDMVIFSFDRPLQLYALLESIKKYFIGVGTISVIYRASTEGYQAGYEEVKRVFSNIAFMQQGTNPRNDFRPLTVHATFSSPHAHIIYAVDDIIGKDFVDLSYCAQVLDETRSYGFYLRLGKNITECYSLHIITGVPPLTQVKPNIYQWRFSSGRGDWIYPNTVDMTIYRKADIERYIRGINYVHPNSLEGNWAGAANLSLNGLCFEQSKIVNLPLNLVNISGNRHEQWKTTAELLAIFNDGFKINLEPIHGLVNKAPHCDYKPEFIKREGM